MRRLLLIALVLALLLTMAAAPAAASNTVIHVVQRGETLAGIAYHYGTTVQAILAANPSIWNPNYIWAGMHLVIPVSGGYPPPPTGICSYYVVRHGDTLAGIARAFGVSPWDIAALNGIYNLNRIYAGMTLRIPCGGVTPPQPPGPPTVINYTVIRGDNLTRIARRYGTTVAAIIRLNPSTIVNPNRILPGQVIRVPVGGG